MLAPSDGAPMLRVAPPLERFNSFGSVSSTLDEGKHDVSRGKAGQLGHLFPGLSSGAARLVAHAALRWRTSYRWVSGVSQEPLCRPFIETGLGSVTNRLFTGRLTRHELMGRIPIDFGRYVEILLSPRSELDVIWDSS